MPDYLLIYTDKVTKTGHRYIIEQESPFELSCKIKKHVLQNIITDADPPHNILIRAKNDRSADIFLFSGDRKIRCIGEIREWVI